VVPGAPDAQILTDTGITAASVKSRGRTLHKDAHDALSSLKACWRWEKAVRSPLYAGGARGTPSLVVKTRGISSKKEDRYAVALEQLAITQLGATASPRMPKCCH